MEVVYPRCSGLDVHKRFVVACLSIVQHGERHKELRQVSTMTSDILAMKAWLKASGCRQIAMESSGVYTPPPMLPIGGGIVRRGWKRGRTDAKDDADLLLIDLNPFD